MTEHEELLRLRREIEEKEGIIKKQDARIEQQNAKIKAQEIQIENMIQALLHARKKMFGASTETTQVDGQLSLFDNVTDLANGLFEDQKKITVKDYTRTPRKPGVRKEMLESLPQEVEEYVIPSEEVCNRCGAPLKVIGKKIVRTEVEYKPAKLVVKQIVQEIAKCTKCGTEEGEYPNDHFQKAAVPIPVLPHSIATSSLVAQIWNQKFALGLPFSRQERDYDRLGLVLSRRNMANWTIRCSEQWLEPLYQRMHECLIGDCEVLHMDETRIQCNKEKGRKASSESYMWVIRSAACETETQGVFFHYSRSRKREIARELLQGFEGYVTCDAYIGYDKLDHIKRNLCWSHVRRYYMDAIPLDKNGKEIPGSKGQEGREYINLLFKVEREIKDLSYEEKKKKRQEASRPILDAFWSWVEKTSALSTTNEKLTKALTYTTNQKPWLETFMEDGRLPISNNLCEANIKPFATARRAWLFADTPKGAKANAILYTLVESARINKLDTYEYLKYLLEEMPNNDHLNHPEILDRYLPWSKELPEECRLRSKKEKCLKK